MRREEARPPLALALARRGTARRLQGRHPAAAALATCPRASPEQEDPVRVVRGRTPSPGIPSEFAGYVGPSDRTPSRTGWSSRESTPNKLAILTVTFVTTFAGKREKSCIAVDSHGRHRFHETQRRRAQHVSHARGNTIRRAQSESSRYMPPLSVEAWGYPSPRAPCGGSDSERLLACRRARASPSVFPSPSVSPSPPCPPYPLWRLLSSAACHSRRQTDDQSPPP